MSELKIYDSQGNGIGRHDGKKNHRVETLFFDGVRLAIERVDGVTKITCFFRARESKSSRSEQYYAVYTGESGNFTDVLKQRVEENLGMDIVTSTDDTEVFRQLQEGEPGDLPRTEQLDDVVELLNTGNHKNYLKSKEPDAGGPADQFLDSAGGTKPAKIGVGTYADGVAVLHYFLNVELSSGRIPSCVIAENADSSDLRDFDIIIQKGDHPGVTLLSETATAVEEIKHQHRPNQEQNDRANDDYGWFSLFTVSLSIVAFMGIILAVLFAGCLLGGPVPDFAPFCDSTDNSQTGNAEPSLGLNATKLDGEGLLVEGTLRGENIGTTPSLQIEILESGSTENGGAKQLVNVSIDATLENGTFRERVPTEQLTDFQQVSNFDSKTYNVTVSYGDASDARILSQASPNLQIDNATWALNYTTGAEGGDLSLEGTLATTRSLARGAEPIPVADQNPELAINYNHNNSIKIDGYDSAVFDAVLYNVTRPETGDKITVGYDTTETTATITIEEQPTAPALRIDSVTWDYTSGRNNGTLSVRGVLANNRSIDNPESERIPVNDSSPALLVSHPDGEQQIEPNYYNNGTFEYAIEKTPQPGSDEEIWVEYNQTSDRKTIDIGDLPSDPELRIESATWTNSSQNQTLSVNATLASARSIDQPGDRVPVDNPQKVKISYQNKTYKQILEYNEDATFEVIIEETTRPDESDSVKIAYDGASDTSPVSVVGI
jgi:hypothetical protein